MPAAGPAVSALLPTLTRALGRLGLHIVRPVSQPALDAAGAGLSLASLLPGARSAIVIADGGPDFFAGFAAAIRDRGDVSTVSDPLDRYTREVVQAAVASVLPVDAISLRFPFGGDAGLPMQRIGFAAGLPEAGPLGIQVHPVFGPWWGYRALLVLREEVVPMEPLVPSCQTCAAPCRPACPVGAPDSTGFRIGVCAEERGRNPSCADACSARQACIVGPEHAYPASQLAFHMRASLAMIRRYKSGAARAKA